VYVDSLFGYKRFDSSKKKKKKLLDHQALLWTSAILLDHQALLWTSAIRTLQNGERERERERERDKVRERNNFSIFSIYDREKKIAIN
jgi:hypothetical protein